VPTVSYKVAVLSKNVLLAAATYSYSTCVKSCRLVKGSLGCYAISNAKWSLSFCRHYTPLKCQ